MRKCLCLILALFILTGLMGCADNDAVINTPVNFYYRTLTSTYADSHKVVDYETREADPHSEDIVQLLNTYLKGPESPELNNPFPDGTTVVSLIQSGQNVDISLSSHFSRLSGIDLTVACACISLTIFDYTDCEQVTIRVSNAVLDQRDFITMTQDDLIIDMLAEENLPQ